MSFVLQSVAYLEKMYRYDWFTKLLIRGATLKAVKWTLRPKKLRGKRKINFKF